MSATLAIWDPSDAFAGCDKEPMVWREESEKAVSNQLERQKKSSQNKNEAVVTGSTFEQQGRDQLTDTNGKDKCADVQEQQVAA